MVGHLFNSLIELDPKAGGRIIQHFTILFKIHKELRIWYVYIYIFHFCLGDFEKNMYKHKQVGISFCLVPNLQLYKNFK